MRRLILLLAAAVSGTSGSAAWAQDGLRIAPDGRRVLAQAHWRHGDTADDVEAMTSAQLMARSRHVALRLGYVSGDRRDVKAIVEWSNGRTHRTMLPGATFRYALGADQRIADSVWLELRVGERRRHDGRPDEAAAFVGLRLTPAARR